MDRTEKLTKLGDVKPGDGKVVRFQGTFFEDALCGKDDACFYMVIKSTPEKAGRVTICSLDGKAVLEIDVDHLVIVHSAKVVVDDAEMI
ncbi:hypothetical protein A3A36_02835 [Candidatus Kaiserbacteria bacterium RIFCSPLOWO2_01_FULL_52_12b]|uniref:Uncharacterized protein n=1 Tax=Candidatus Kaiserbacteria bacterium RIFCSPLOWO2_01_FULL_52_12b TaxID=1798509 RepID=A0A1F6EWS6_9BACT|nr:MAG: hypothetical protein A3A36_02835 [Candidatus Kaiserbacteria bacterium RIFCSPLOWO2_01_FULL_52_12b]